ncbi:hypothetical protein [Spirosoma luteum]|uniref:hypothetical protein n=1 Tax=Spirosoma luteum TaxID=431553 RepID=UPI000382C2F7|nr:hypothetical protein [Spirosoma luteum]
MISTQNGEAFGSTEQGVWYERICLLDGKTYRHELPLTLESFQQSYERMRSGVVIQDAFPTLAPQDREFILSGITPQRWDKIFPPLPALDETVISQILQELKPVIVDLFGNDSSKPFNLEGLTIEALHDYPRIDDSLRSQALGWVRAWVEREGFLNPSMNSAS